MRSLKQFIEDFISTTPIPSGATPMNTIGMGDISISQPGSGEICSEPLCGSPKPCKRKKKHQYNSLVQMVKEII